MLELQAVPADVVACFGLPEALDGLTGDGDGRRCLRIALDEVLLLGERSRLAELEAELSALDSGGFAVDLSSAFSIWALRGDGRFEAFGRLSEIELSEPPSLIQGLFARVPAKVVVLEDELLVLVASTLGAHTRRRVLEACADLAPVESVRVSVRDQEAALA